MKIDKNSIEKLTKEELTSPDFYNQLCVSDEFRDPIARGGYKFLIQERARVLKIKSHVDDQLREVEKRIHDEERAERADRNKVIQSIDGITNFEPDAQGTEYMNLYCGSWIATEDGIQSQESSRANQIACYHPILPVKRMRNMENGEEQITLAFKRRGENELWNEIIVPKDMVANSRSITSLAKYGIGVTSESAKLLVKYLADVEHYNEDRITLVQGSSKLGWHGNEFLPYDPEITFDAATKFQQIWSAITESGSFSVWLEHVKKIRAASYVEPRLALAASFSSVIIKFLNIASPLIDFWGSTEAGKTVMLMLATSVWACPDEGLYMGDFLTTDAELEVRSDMLNHLPLVLDDTAKMRKNIRDNIEQVIYNLSSGSGKKRSNKELGSERVRTWKNTVIVNGERPLSSFVEQGGAINRILEIGLSEERLFESPQETADLVRENYGFAGKMFIEYLKKIDQADIRKRHKMYCSKLETKDTMQKQVLSMAAILAADEMATEAIFHDGKNLSPNDVQRYLTDRQFVSEGARCYEYLMGVYAEKGQHFDIQYSNIDQWGVAEYDEEGKKYINFYVNALCDLVKEKGFSRKAFTSWAKREKLLRWNTSKDRDVYGVRGQGGQAQTRYISIRVVDLDDYEAEKDMFD